jgi:hypothetical protein
MSNTKREPLLSDEELMELTYVKEDGRRPSEQVRDFYEAARAKDAELIQRLVDALEWVAAYDNGCPLPTWERGYNNAWSIANSARAAAKAAGFKPSDL